MFHVVLSKLSPNSCNSKTFVILSQVAFCLALASVAAAIPQGAYKEVKEIPKPYTYQYAVADDYSKANFQKSESQDSNVSQLLFWK